MPFDTEWHDYFCPSPLGKHFEQYVVINGNVAEPSKQARGWSEAEPLDTIIKHAEL